MVNDITTICLKYLIFGNHFLLLNFIICMDKNKLIIHMMYDHTMIIN